MKNLSRIALAVVMMASASLNAASDTPAAVSEQTTPVASTPVETVVAVVDVAPVATVSEQPAPAVNSVPAETAAPVVEVVPAAVSEQTIPAASTPVETVVAVVDVEGPVYGPAPATAQEMALMLSENFARDAEQQAQKASTQGRFAKAWNSTKTFAGQAKDFAAAKATESKTFAQDQYKTNPTRTIVISAVAGVAALAATAKLAYNKWVKRSSCNDESCDVQA